MKVIKDNQQNIINEMLACVESATYPIIQECSKCKSELEIDKIDLNLEFTKKSGLFPYVDCPVCGNTTAVTSIKYKNDQSKQPPLDFSASNWWWWTKRFLAFALWATIGILIGYYIL